MSDDINRISGGWLDDDDSGLYEEASDWLDEADDPEPIREFEHLKLPKESELEAENARPKPSPKEGEIVVNPLTGEPEEERTDWNETPSRPEPEEPDAVSGISLSEEEEKRSIPNPFLKIKEKMSGALQGAEPGKYLNRKILLMAAAGAVCALVIFGIVLAVSRMGSGTKEPEPEVTEEPENLIATEKVPVAEVKHLSFFQLSMEHMSDRVSVKEFSQILDMLYNDDYVLIDVYSLADVDENGNYALKETIDVPEGKKPLILSVQDVSYPASRQTSGFAKRMVVDGEGLVHNEYVDETGMAEMGDFDVIPIVDSFVREHPDFSYNGAKGLIGLTGYNGVFGYRTSLYPETGESPFGAVDYESEKQSAEIVINAVRNSGWRFACNGYAQVSYGSEYSMIETDITSWQEKVAALVGGTDLLIFPRDTDIGSWAPYTSDNPKYVLMREMGYRYFFIEETETPDFLQVEKEYVREAITEIHTFAEFRDYFE